MKNKEEKKVEVSISIDVNYKKFRIVELDILRGDIGSTFMTLVEAKDVQNAIETFYKRFPDSGSHIMVVPDEYAVEHTGYLMPRMAVKIQKKIPLIKLQ